MDRSASARRRDRGRDRDRDRAGWLAAGYAGLAGFLALEAVARKPGDASSVQASEADRGTTGLIVAAYAAGGCLAPVLRRMPVGRLPRAAAPLGLALQASGLLLRGWSMRALGSSYTRTLRTEEELGVVSSGPYRLVRHPGYTGSLLIWAGFALTSRSGLVVAAITGMLVLAYGRRMIAEEALLRRDLPGYDDYCRRTARFIPGVW